MKGKLKSENMKKNIMTKTLALITAVIALTGCANQNVKDVSAIINDGIQAVEVVDNDIKEDVKATEDAETEPTPTTAPAEAESAPTAAPAEAESAPTAAPAEAEPAPTAAPAEAESAPTAAPAEAEPVPTAKPAESEPVETAPPDKTKPAEAEPAPVYQCSCGFTASTEEELWNHIIEEALKEDAGSQGSGGGTQSSETGSSGEQPAETQAPPAETQPAVTVPAEPEHTHVWKEHMAETQTWVPNIVVVDDYETQKVAVGGLYICTSCGYETSDVNDINDHLVESILEGTGCASYQDIVQYEDQQVKVGSHEEDQGHYETTSYVDYYYCDCGATK